MHNISRLKKRSKIINYLYKELLLKNTINSKDAFESGEFSDSEIKIIEHIVNNFNKFKSIIIKFLKKDWSWERLMILIKAILIYGCCELIVHDKALVINELVTITRGYIPGDDYKFVNGILNKIGDYYEQNKNN